MLESFVNVGSSVVRCVTLAVQRQHAAVALAWVCGLGLGFGDRGLGLDTCGLVNITGVMTSGHDDEHIE